MNRENEVLLNDEIQSELKALEDLSLGTDEYEKTVNGLTKLMDRSIELQKIKAEADNNEANREVDSELKMMQMADEKKDRRVKNILTGLGIAIPSGVAIWGTLKSFKFEETGTITTILGRGWINKLIPKK